MNDKTTSASGGIGFGGVLGTLFIALKLLGVIHWSWLWVLAPLWIPLALVGAILIVCFGAPLAFMGVVGLLGLFRKS